MDQLKTIFMGLLIWALLAAQATNALANSLVWHGFAEVLYGAKLRDDTTKHENYNVLEQRLQLKSTYYFEGEHYLAEKGGAFNVKGDFTVDEYFGGKTDAELRELNLSLSPLSFMDLKVGRQVLTWGTGDYLFVNDLFPKDYESFFIGRADEYLKKPSDALKVSLYHGWGNVDVIAAAFRKNTQADGERLSFYDLFEGGLAGRESERDLLEPPLQLSNNEYYLRYYRNVQNGELAFYYFRGFDKNTTSVKNEAQRQFYYRRLDSYGASWRAPVAGGIGNLEAAYYNSREDPDGMDRLIENSAFKALAGYEKDLGHDLKAGVQYLFEQRLDYDEYASALLAGDPQFDEHRHVFTQRITKLFRNQTVTASLFNFYSPSDKDGYVRPSVAYDVNDQWNVAVGANIPWGDGERTEFAQMKRNKNVYVRARYSF